MKTRSAFLKSPWQCELRTVELPDAPAAGQVLIRVEACGICGTDLSAAETQAKDWQAFGHEIAGVVEQVGPGEPRLKPGDKVVLESSSYCGTCEVCRSGRVDLCNRAPNFWNQPAMGFSDRMLAPAVCAVPYDGLSPDAACLAEPAGVAFDMVKVADIQLGDRVCVVGPGPIALLAVALARHRGAERVLCIGRPHHTRRLDIARRLGAETLGTDQPLDQLADLRGRFQHVLMTAPVQFIPPALAMLAYEGKLTYIGIGTGSGTISFDANDFHFRKLQLRASFASPAIYYPQVLRLLKAGILPGEEIISHRFRLADIAAALRLCRDQKATTGKVVVNP